MAKITRHGGASDDTVPAPEEEAEVEIAETPAAEPEVEETPAVEPEPEQADEESSPSSEAAEPGPAPDYEAMTVEELKEELGERGLVKSGKRDDLVLRLLEDDDARATASETE
ncbi:SAP domain-containing protein [Streptomyces chartreusis]|uniref:SAP domain-containing protein n=1 Tax=Streptomyces chartreusis TaxID=1969 RepID=UPI0034004F70